jgi:hypothetical protein
LASRNSATYRAAKKLNSAITIAQALSGLKQRPSNYRRNELRRLC